MKKLFPQHSRMILALIISLGLSSCNTNNNNYPDNYVGFERGQAEYSFSATQSEASAEVTIIASKKDAKDRTVVLTAPATPFGQEAVFQLTESKIILKAGKKSVSTTIKFFPKEMVVKQQRIELTCTPQWEKGEISKMSIQLKRQ